MNKDSYASQSALRLREEICKPRMVIGNEKHQFITGPYGMLRRESFEKLVWACKTIGACIWDSPSGGITVNDEGYDTMDYLAADLMREPEEVEEALSMLDAYFHPTVKVTLDEWNKRT